MFNNLYKYGWNPDLASEFQKIHAEKPNLVPGRVISVHRTQYEIMTENGLVLAEITGNRLKDTDVYEKPVVGDWVFLCMGERDNANIIEAIALRKTIVERRRAHSDNEVQIMAANVDRAIIVQSLANDVSISRIQRVLVQLRKSNINAVIVFNKVDIAGDLEQVKKDITKLNDGIPVIFASYKTRQGIRELQKQLTPGKTLIFIGSSGVGKSSIINTMLTDDRKQKTGAVSDYSGKGKHTTTARKLFLLDNGAIVIDTPGTREFGLTVDDEMVNQSFSIIEEIAQDCKFRNCQHNKEPGCAVKEALSSGSLDQQLFDTYIKLKQETEKDEIY